MAILNQKRILNLIPKVSAPVTIHVSQGDVGTEIEFTLVKGDEVFVNPGNVSASVHGVREDSANFGPFTCTLNGSKVTFPLHSEMTAVKGSAFAEIVLVDNSGHKVGSANFGILVEESVFPLGVTYDNDVSVYESILKYVQTLNTALNNEISTRQSADLLINERIDEIIAPSGGAPSAAEVTDARIDIYGATKSTLGGAIRDQFNETLMPRGSATGASVDFNNLSPGFTRIYNTTNPAHSPVSNPFGWVITSIDEPTNGNSKTQLYTSYTTSESYIRYSANGVWNAWKKIASANHADAAYNAMIPPSTLSLTGAGIDFNELAVGLYRIYSTTSPSHSPVPNPFGFIAVVDDLKTGGQELKTQIYLSYVNTNESFIRYYSTLGWSGWTLLSGEFKETVVISPNDDLYNIIKSIKNNTHVIIKAGTYDISSAVAATSDIDYSSDMHIKPGCWIEGVGKPKIVCKLNSKRTYTSVFMFDYGYGKISGIEIDAKNTRYAIHDDTANNQNNVQYEHIIEDCVISYEGIANGTTYIHGCSIGGGMGANITNTVKNNVILADTNAYPIHYHTSSAGQSYTVVSAGKLNINDNYLNSGTVAVDAIDADTGEDRDIVVVNGNRVTSNVAINNNSAHTIVPCVWNNAIESNA